MIKEDKVSSYYFTIFHYIFTSLSFDVKWRLPFCCISYDKLYKVSTNRSHFSIFRFKSLTFSSSKIKSTVYEAGRFV